MPAGDGQPFLHGKTQFVAADQAHSPVGHEAGKGSGWFAAADDDDIDAIGNMIEDAGQQVVKFAFRTGILEIVQHQQAGRGETLKDLAKVAPGEYRQPQVVFRRQDGQGAVAQRLRGLSQVVEEGGRIGIVGVHLVPQALRLPGCEVGRHQGGLAGTRRGMDPHHGLLARLVQPDMQALTLQHPAGIRAVQFYLGQGHR